MLYAKKRRIAELEALAAMLRDELDKAREAAEVTVSPAEWEERAHRFANDRIKAACGDAREMARLNDVAQGWVVLAGQEKRRAERLARAVVRYWTEISRLRRELYEQSPGVQAGEVRELKARLAAQEERLLTLQTANMANDWRGHTLTVAS